MNALILISAITLAILVYGLSFMIIHELEKYQEAKIYGRRVQ